VDRAKRYEPDPRRHEAYQRYTDLYHNMLATIDALYDELAKVESE
jgi:sugar (pentulose or hexulose) kinase